MNLPGLSSAGLSTRSTLIAIAALCAWPVSSARAVTTSWNSDFNGTFTSPANWDNGVPDSDDMAVFNRGFFAYAVDFPGGSIFEPPPNYVINYLRVRTNEVSFIYIVPPFLEARPIVTVANAGDSIVVGETAGDVAILNMAISRLSGANASIGGAPGAVGTLNVSGTFSMSHALEVGSFGTGTLNVISGGRVESTSSKVGYLAGSMGVATVSGAESNWTVNELGGLQGDLSVGFVGTGELNIIGSGTVSCQLASIGFEGHGNVAVTGAGSTWSIAEGLTMGGPGGSGMLAINDGAAISSGSSIIGYDSTGTGEVVVTGAGSTWTANGRIGLGGNWITNESGGPATLSIGPGATVSNTFFDEIVIFPQGTLNLQGGTLDFPHVYFSDVGGQFNFTAGRLRTSTYDGNLLNQGGTLAPRGIIDVLGSYTQQSAAKLQIRIGGTTVFSQYNRLDATGSVSLDGALEVVLFNDFMPSAGQSFDILDWGSLSGTFSSVLLPGLNSGLSWNTSQLYATGVISIVGTPVREADFDEDLDVDADDLAQWRLGFGTASAADHMDGDADGDADVDGGDFLVWQRQLGSAPPVAATAVVPEPGTIAHFVIALAGFRRTPGLKRQELINE